METKQPIWRYLQNIGDCTPLEYGGAFVFEDTTGVYAPELEILEEPQVEWYGEPEDDPRTWTVYCLTIEPHTFEDGVLSDNPFHKGLAVWYADKLQAVASSADAGYLDFVSALVSGPIVACAQAYLDLVSYFGAHEFDSYPLTLTREEVFARYAEKGVPL